MIVMSNVFRCCLAGLDSTSTIYAVNSYVTTMCMFLDDLLTVDVRDVTLTRDNRGHHANAAMSLMSACIGRLWRGREAGGHVRVQWVVGVRWV